MNERKMLSSFRKLDIWPKKQYDGDESWRGRLQLHIWTWVLALSKLVQRKVSQKKKTAALHHTPPIPTAPTEFNICSGCENGHEAQLKIDRFSFHRVEIREEKHEKISPSWAVAGIKIDSRFQAK